MNMPSECAPTTWRLLPYAVVFTAAFTVYGIFVPQLDGTYPNQLRLGFFLCIAFIYWARFVLSRLRNEKTRGYRIYYTLILMSTPLEIILELILSK